MYTTCLIDNFGFSDAFLAFSSAQLSADQLRVLGQTGGNGNKQADKFQLGFSTGFQEFNWPKAKMASSLVTRKFLYEEIRRKYPKVETNSATVDFIEATRLTLADLLEIEPDKLSEKGQVNFEAEASELLRFAPF